MSQDRTRWPPRGRWLEKYSRQTVEELLALEGKYRIDSLIEAFHQAIDQKAARRGMKRLTKVERMVLAVAALEAEVNNGGFHLFFVNSSREFAPEMVGVLRRIGCPAMAKITQRALDALGVSDVTAESIDAAMAEDDGARSQKLAACDRSYYATNARESPSQSLFTFIKAHRDAIRI